MFGETPSSEETFRSPLERINDAQARTEEYEHFRKVGEGFASVSMAEALVRSIEQIHENVQKSGKGFSGYEPGLVDQLTKMVQILGEEGQIFYQSPDQNFNSSYSGIHFERGEGHVVVKNKQEHIVLDLKILKEILGEDAWQKVIKEE